jgi:hypothetical protein
MADNYLITGYWGEPHVTAENDRGINAAMFGTGRFVLPVGGQFRAEYIGNNTIRMYDGKLMDNGAAAGIPVGEYVDLLIANAGQGMKRNDLIVFQYKQDASTLIESGKFVVIQGVETDGTASDPELTQEDLLSGEAAFDQMALWRVSVSGATISAPVKLFSVSSDLAHKAPAGLIQKLYDIETDAELTAAIDDLWSNTADWSEGHFAFNMRKSVGQIYGGIWHITSYKANSSYGVIKAVGYNASHPTIMYLNKMQTWAEWEWVNPPMTLGAEYRTTERFNGKVVYTKLIYCGAITNGAVVDTGRKLTFRHAGNISLSNSIPYALSNKENTSYWADSYVEDSRLHLSCGSGFGGYNWYEQIWYTKD